jgi:hypothetical protein
MRSSVGTLLLGVVLVAIAVTPADPGWVSESKTDSVPGQGDVHTLSTYSVGAPEGRVIVRCAGHKLDVQFELEEFHARDQAAVRYQANAAPWATDTWFTSAKGTAVSARHAAEIARLLMRSETFIIEAEDRHGHSHGSKFELAGAPLAIEPVLQACGLSVAGMSQDIEGLRYEIGVELETWGPDLISQSKRILASLGAYTGPQNLTIEPAFALAVQSFYDDYIARCKAGKDPGGMCNFYRSIVWKPGHPAEMPPVSVVIYGQAPEQIKAEFGKRKKGGSTSPSSPVTGGNRGRYPS